MKEQANSPQNLPQLGEFGGVNPSISDSSTYAFQSAREMADAFSGKAAGCYLYSRHSSPSNLYLEEALAALEGTEAAHVTASGMGAIAATLLQLCRAGDHIVCSRTLYGGTYALMQHMLGRLDITVSFVSITRLHDVESAVTERTRLIFCESVSNPLLEIADIPALTALARRLGLPLVVDNTFSPLSLSPARLGADIVIHSLTKFINGSGDCVAGAVCGSQAFCMALKDVNEGAAMLLGSTLDSMRAASILKNMRTLPLRIRKHSENALFLARQLERDGFRVAYPGLLSHPGHPIMRKQMDASFGFGGIFTLDTGSLENAQALMESMQKNNLGYLAVSLGYFKTLFSAPGHSTSSEIPSDAKGNMGLTNGLIRFSIGLDDDIHHTYDRMSACIEALELCAPALADS